MAKLINISALHGYLETIQEIKFDPRSILEQCDIDYGMLLSQEGYISFVSLAKLLELTAQATENPYFGLQLSQRQNLPILGILGLLMEKSPDIRSALRECVRYFHIHTQGAEIELVEEEKVAMITYRILVDAPSTQQTIDLSIGTACNVMRLLSRRNFSPHAIYFSHANSGEKKVYTRVFNAPVVFNHELNAVVFDRQLLDRPITGHDQTIQRILKRSLESSNQQIEEDIESEVRKLITRLLPVGYCSLDLAAKQLNMSPRKLQYLLAEKSTTFKELLDQVRISIAQQQLLQSKIPLSQLCEILGYSDQTAFSRAFKRWFGVSPKNWQKHHASRHL